MKQNIWEKLDYSSINAPNIVSNKYLVRMQTERQWESLPEMRNFLKTSARLCCQLYLNSTVHCHRRKPQWLWTDLSKVSEVTLAEHSILLIYRGLPQGWYPRLPPIAMSADCILYQASFFQMSFLFVVWSRCHTSSLHGYSWRSELKPPALHSCGKTSRLTDLSYLFTRDFLKRVFTRNMPEKSKHICGRYLTGIFKGKKHQVLLKVEAHHNLLFLGKCYSSCIRMHLSLSI